MKVSDTIQLKRAVRNFTDQPLPEETILAILNAGRRAQTSKNTQPWHFIVIADKVFLKQFSDCVEWAGHLTGAALGVASENFLR
jgi:nitroreductase